MIDMISAPHRLAMGLVSVPEEECWLEVDEDLEADLAITRDLLANNREQVFVEIPASRPAQEQALALVRRTLEQHHPSLVESSPFVSSTNLPPLEVAALLVQEGVGAQIATPPQLSHSRNNH